jgi:hypothetical protein
MPETFIEFSEDAFDASFPLLPNHLNPNASWTFGEGRGCLFETFGDELEFVHRQDLRSVWTLIDTDDVMCVISGYHLVNRVGYLLSSLPVPAGITIVVPLQSEGDEL